MKKGRLFFGGYLKESRRLFGKPIPGNQSQSRLAARGLDQRNPGIEMGPIVLRQVKVFVILMKGEIGYRSLEILDLIERGPMRLSVAVALRFRE
jgi:hypothetical protein